MTLPEEEFLKAGIHRYAEAESTIRTFREMLSVRLVAVLKAKSSFGDFERDGHAPVDLGFRANAPLGHWGAATATGSVKGLNLTIEIGVWWPRRAGMPGVTLYVSMPDKSIIKPMGSPLMPAGLRFEDIAGDKHYVFLEPGEQLDFDQDFDRLIRAFALLYIQET